jgi:hypothetical protein
VGEEQAEKQKATVKASEMSFFITGFFNSICDKSFVAI